MHPSLLLDVNFGLVHTFLLIGLIICLLLSSFFSASETAYSTASAIRMRTYADEKRKGARKALYIIDHYDKTLATILVGNNFVNIASTTICAIVFAALITDPTLSNVLNTVIMTIIVLIFGEIMPKSLAKANAEKVALKFSGVMFVLIKVMTPITFVFMWLQRLLLRKVKNDNPTVTEDELESIIDTMEEEGVLDAKDADIFQGVMDLGEQETYDIMTPRIDVTAIDIDEDTETLKDLFITSEYSRIPVYQGDKDHMIGIVHIKDFMQQQLSGKKFKIADIMTDPLFVSENLKAKELIRTMQSEKKHMAIVIDEHGGTSGVVTFEDVMEEMLGDIYDEHDDEIVESYITESAPNEYDVSPDIALDDLFETLKIEHVPENEHASLGGYLFSLSQELPQEGQKLEVVTIDEDMDEHGSLIERTVKLEFEISEIEDMRIKNVHLKVLEVDDDKKKKAV